MEDQRSDLTWPVVLPVTLLTTAPVVFVLFVMGLVVVETVIYPVATLGVAVTAGLVSGWVSNRVTRPGSHTDFSTALGHALALAAWVAIATPIFALIVNRLIYVIATTWLVVGVTATWATLRYRLPGRADRRDLRTALSWLAGSVLGAVLVISLAAAAGLTGA